MREVRKDQKTGSEPQRNCASDMICHCMAGEITPKELFEEYAKVYPKVNKGAKSVKVF